MNANPFLFIRPRLSQIFLFLLLLAALGTPPGFAQDKLPRFEPAECPFARGDWEKGAKIECKWFLVSESREIPKSRTIKLAVVIVRAMKPDGSAPIVMLHGGPGDSSISRVRAIVASGLGAPRDVVLYDQRGSGESRPKLCPDYWPAVIKSQTLPTQAERNKAFSDSSQACTASLDAQGVDRSAYNTVVSAEDLVDLRKFLGYEVWTIMASSYGGRLAQEVMVRDGKAVRSVILENPVVRDARFKADFSLSSQFAVERVFADCKAQAECAAAFPDLEADFYDVYRDLNNKPIIVPTDSSEVTLHGRRFVNRIRNAILGQPTRLARLPLLINEIRRGDRMRAAKVLIGNSAQGPRQGDQVLVHLINCYDSYSKQFLDSQNSANAKVKEPFRSDELTDCEQWQKRFSDPAKFVPLKSDIPALITTGRYDDRTPLSHAKSIASGLTHAYVYEFPNEGHATFPSICRFSIIAQFVKDPFHEPNASCISKIPPVKFITSWDQVPGTLRPGNPP